MLGFVLSAAGNLSAAESASLTSPLTILLAFICLSPWYSCRSLPLRSTNGWKLLLHHLVAAMCVSALVLIIARILVAALGRVFTGIDAKFHPTIPVLAGMVALLYLLAIALHYVLLALESSRQAELLSREAELKALKAQVNPHFLFNCLNSISALTTVDPSKAREMCIRLSDFLRNSLRLGERVSIPFFEELELTRTYLEVEQVRYGQRLRVAQDFDPLCADCEVPPLLVQPLVENAIKHGIATLIDGGEIAITGRCSRGAMRVTIENPFDPDAPAARKSGLGLRNVRNRLQARYGDAARLEVQVEQDRYRVVLLLPCNGIQEESLAMKIRAVIVDDEDLARQILREYLRGEEDIEVVAECGNGFDAVKLIAEHKPDLLFLDVQMPKLDGFEVLELAGNESAVVFVTAYDQYAMKAFDAAAVDYLLKPFDLDRFRTALQRVRRRLGETVHPTGAELKKAALPPGQYAQRIVVKDGARVHIIPITQLDYVEAQDDYVALHSGGKVFLKQQTISSLEGSLDPAASFVSIVPFWLI